MADSDNQWSIQAIIALATLLVTIAITIAGWAWKVYRDRCKVNTQYKAILD